MIKWKLCSLLSQPFLWSILAVIFLAYSFPDIGSNGGAIRPEITVKYIAVSIIFFISGLSLKTQELASAASQFHIHIFIQCFSLLFIPLIVQLLIQLLGQFYSNPNLLLGFITVSCMPAPVSSAVILTKAAGGNEAAAVFNSALGSFLGIVVTPALLFIFLGESGNMPLVFVFLQLSGTVVLPVIVGQIARKFIGDYFLFHKKQLSVIGSFMLLLIIFTAFCDTFSKKNSVFELSTVIITSVTVILLQFVLMALSFLITSNLNMYFTSDDTVAILFCSTHKSLTLGFPMLKLLYGNESNFLLISLPLLIYHPTQILIGSLLLPFLQEWRLKARKK